MFYTSAPISGAYYSCWCICSLVTSGEDELLIERSAHTGMINPGDPWQTIPHDGPVARLVYRVRVRCDENYYGNKCNKLCVPRDDYFGHYQCEASGARVCLDGWMGPHCSMGERHNQTWILLAA